jgi:5-methylcytosine-specific restriction endonuclease McrA
VKRSAPLRHYAPLRKRKPRKGDVTVGKTGRIRLRGKALEALRRDCFERDRYRCQCSPSCGVAVTWESGDMAHIVSRGAGGSDVLSNVRTFLHEHHLASHNAGGKPLPPKVKA